MSNGTNLMIDLDQSEYLRAKIKVIGVGGGGSNAIENMIQGNLEGVELIAANTDSQALNTNHAKIKIQLGLRTTKGLGAGSNPEVGKKAAEESEQDIIDALKDAEMVFVTCGMGGGTGTGAAPIVAKVAKELGSLVVAIVTKPFEYEGKVRLENSKKGIEELKKNVDAIIVIPNQKIYEIIGDDTDVEDAMIKIDEILLNSTKGISDIINLAGKFNVDFADVRTIMMNTGQALMGIGSAEGKNRAEEAAIKAITSPLLDGISIQGAKGLLVNITGGQIIRQSEIQTIINTIKKQTGDEINLIHGIVKTGVDTDLLSVTVIATGFDSDKVMHSASPSGNGDNVIRTLPSEQPRIPIKSNMPSIFHTNNTTVNNIPVSEVVKPYKTQMFDKSQNQNPSNEINIPKGHSLREYDTPAFIRNGSASRDINEDAINTTFIEPNIISDATPEPEEIKLDNYHQGFDIMSAPSSLERNNFSKFSY